MSSADKGRVLIVDDETAIRRIVRVTLEAGGFSIFEAANGQEAIIAAAAERPDVILLDLNLPDIHGLEVLKRLREWYTRSIIILSVVNDEETIVKSLDLGADDYLTKPFGAKEIIARIRVCLRHQNAGDDAPTYLNGSLKVDLSAREVFRDEERLKLTVTEYDVLRTLIKHAGKALTHRQIVTEIWGPRNVAQQLNNLRVVIARLRHKVERDPDQPEMIQTEPGVGYRLVAFEKGES